MSGRLVSVHRKTAGRVLTFCWAYLLLAGIALGIGVLLVAVSKGTWQNGALLPGIIITLLGLPLLAVYPIRMLVGVSEVRVYDDGLEWGRDKSQRASWEDIKEVYRKDVYQIQAGSKPSDWNRHSQLRLVLRDRREVSFNHGLSNYDKFAALVQDVSKQVLTPRFREELENGEVSFGPVKLSASRIKTRDGSDPLDQIRQLDVRNGWLVWQTQKGFKREIALHDIPNYLVLLELLSEMRG